MQKSRTPSESTYFIPYLPVPKGCWVVFIILYTFIDQAHSQSIIFSGSFFRQLRKTIIEGWRYAHIIGPRTGYPIQGIQSATIVCPDAELADSLALNFYQHYY